MPEGEMASSKEARLANARAAIERWAENVISVDAGAGGNGFKKSMMLEELRQLPIDDLSEEQRSAIEELDGMSLSTGIEPERIRELARLF